MRRTGSCCGSSRPGRESSVNQYVAILSGVGGWAGTVVANDLDTRDKTASTGWANALPDLPQKTQKGGMLYVFALP